MNKKQENICVLSVTFGENQEPQLNFKGDMAYPLSIIANTVKALTEDTLNLGKMDAGLLFEFPKKQAVKKKVVKRPVKRKKSASAKPKTPKKATRKRVTKKKVKVKQKRDTNGRFKTNKSSRK